MVKLEVGEDEVVFCSGCDYVVNVERVEFCNLVL